MRGLGLNSVEGLERDTSILFRIIPGCPRTESSFLCFKYYQTISHVGVLRLNRGQWEFRLSPQFPKGTRVWAGGLVLEKWVRFPPWLTKGINHENLSFMGTVDNCWWCGKDSALNPNLHICLLQNC